jgi:hypothetical protein
MCQTVLAVVKFLRCDKGFGEGSGSLDGLLAGLEVLANHGQQSLNA